MIKVFNLTSSLHDKDSVDFLSGEFIGGIIKSLKSESLVPCQDFGMYDSDDSLIYVRTGGTEGIFKALFDEGRIKGSKPVRLLTSGKHNSLAASMEILSFLNSKGRRGTILHGNSGEIASSLDNPDSAVEKARAEASILKPFLHHNILKGKRYGVVGQPSDWLISSDVDYKEALNVLGCEIVDIPMEEIVNLVKEGDYTAPEGLNKLNEPKFGHGLDEKSFSTAVNIYGAASELIKRYRLDGFTLRCFDLLTTVGNTGCLALAQLNSEGFIATCEGDVPAMLSMAIGRELYGHSGFQANLSKVDGDVLLFAHCTVPFNMVRSYCYDTHFESGIGVGIHGEFPQNAKARIVKISADLKLFLDEPLTIERNQYENSLCRTQILVRQLSPVSSYMLNNPCGNHHIIFLD